MAQRIILRTGTQAQIPILEVGEAGYVTDVRALVVGDGSSTPPEFMSTKSTGSFNFETTDTVYFNKIFANLYEGLSLNAYMFYFGRDSGLSADALNVTNVIPPLATLIDGDVFLVVKGPAPNATVTPTLTIGTTAPAPIVKQDGISLLAIGDIAPNTARAYMWDAANSVYRDLGFVKSEILSIISSIVSSSVAVYYCVDAGSSNSIVVPVSGIVTLSDGIFLDIKPAADNTSSTTLTINAIPSIPILRPDGTALLPHDIRAGKPALVVVIGSVGYLINAVASLSNLIYNIVSLTGTSYVYVLSDNNTSTHRSNGGSTMTDTLSASGLRSGWSKEIANVDSTATLTVATVGSALDGVSNGFINLRPTQSVGIRFDGTNFFTYGHHAEVDGTSITGYGTVGNPYVAHAFADGTSINGTGTSASPFSVHPLVPVTSIVGATNTYVDSNRGTLCRRSNAGAPMSDTLQASGLSAGWYTEIGNYDTTALLIIKTAGSATIDGNNYIYLGPQQSCSFRFDGTNFFTVGRPSRCKLATNTTLWVRSDGIDTNTGLSNTSGAAFQTIPGAMAAILNAFDTGSYSIGLKMGIPGSYAGAAIQGNSYVSNLVLSGNVAGGSGYILTDIPFGSGRSCFGATGAITTTIQDLELEYNYNAGALPLESAVAATNGAVIYLSSGITDILSNARSSFTDLYSQSAGNIVFAGNPTITGSVSRYAILSANEGGQFGMATSANMLLASGMTVSGAFAVATDLSIIYLHNMTYSGGALTGSKFSTSLGALIDTGTGNINALPGTTPGTTAPAGIYN
jgi:hypothetical protein